MAHRSRREYGVQAFRHKSLKIKSYMSTGIFLPTPVRTLFGKKRCISHPRLSKRFNALLTVQWGSLRRRAMSANVETIWLKSDSEP